MSKGRIVVGMSGGVDSSLTALLLKDQGYEVVGVTLRVLPDVDGSYDVNSDFAVLRAREVAQNMGIEHHVAVCSDVFTKEVLSRCYENFIHGGTPNPCTYCNRFIKFGWLLDYAQTQCGAVKMATGHYVKLVDREGTRRMCRGADVNKDQSYFLFALTDEQRAHIEMPLGDFTKSEVRVLALEHGIASAKDSDSQDICFDIHGNAYTHFLEQHFGSLERPGFFTDESGKKLAPHQGCHRYTIGQRKGLGVAMGVPAFVKTVDSDTGNVVLTTERDHLACGHMLIQNTVWHGGISSEKFDCLVQTRYRQHAVSCTVHILSETTAEVFLEVPLLAVTKGQAAVFYEKDMLLGGGWIQETNLYPIRK